MHRFRAFRQENETPRPGGWGRAPLSSNLAETPQEPAAVQRFEAQSANQKVERGTTFYRPLFGGTPTTSDADGMAQPSPTETSIKPQDQTAEAESSELEARARRMERRNRRGFAEDGEDFENSLRRKKSFKVNRGEAEDEQEMEAAAARQESRARKAARKIREQIERAKGNIEGRGAKVELPEFTNVSNLSQALGVRYEKFVRRLKQLGYDDIFPGKVLNSETSGMIAMEYNFEPVFATARASGMTEEAERNLKPQPEPEDTTYLNTRPAVVTIMGHVDHGKTTILDYLRNSSVAAGEAGGITQHIGAFAVPLSSSGKTVTFVDTPGHAAFMSMRQRGANITDIVVLVVAADDSVKPQTLESIRCANEAGVPMIVAVNKIDKPEADAERVKQDLSRQGVEIEDYGGEVQVVCVSGKTGQGLDDLEEAVVALSETLDKRAETSGAVEGWVLEATKKRSGRVATVLVRRGVLRPGICLVAGTTWAKVRTLKDERGHHVSEIGPGLPVEVDGWKDQPAAGDEVLQAPSEQKARDVVDYRRELQQMSKMSEDTDAINEVRRQELEKRINAAKEMLEDNSGQKSKPDGSEESGQIAVPFLIKADVSGSAEAMSAYVPSITSPLIRPLIVSSQVGGINPSDIDFAHAIGAHIIAFNLPADDESRRQAESRGVKVLENDVIYRVLDQVREVLEDRLPPLTTQRVLGEAEIGMVFEIKTGRKRTMKIAGCKVRNGVVAKGRSVRVLRNGEKIYDGELQPPPSSGPFRSAIC